MKKFITKEHIIKGKKNYALNNKMHSFHFYLQFTKIFPGHFGRNEITRLISGNTIVVFPRPGSLKLLVNNLATVLIISIVLFLGIKIIGLHNYTNNNKPLNNYESSNNINQNSKIIYNNNFNNEYKIQGILSGDISK